MPLVEPHSVHLTRTIVPQRAAQRAGAEARAVRAGPADDHRGDRRAAAAGTDAVADRHQRVGVEPRSQAGEMHLQRRGDEDMRRPALRPGSHRRARRAPSRRARGVIGSLDARERGTRAASGISMPSASVEQAIERGVEGSVGGEAAAVERRHAEFAAPARSRRVRGMSGSGSPSCNRCCDVAQPGEKVQIGRKLVPVRERAQARGAAANSVDWIGKSRRTAACAPPRSGSGSCRGRADLRHTLTSRTRTGHVAYEPAALRCSAGRLAPALRSSACR